MCGIYASICSVRETDKDAECSFSERLRHLLCNRGPDYFGHNHSRNLRFATAENDDSYIRLCSISTVLSLRGDSITKQPLSDQRTGSFLCWNGEAWKYNGNVISGNDGSAIFDILSNMQQDGMTKSNQEDPYSERGKTVLDTLRLIDGPFAFIYLDQPAGKLYFGRDRLGRRSLLMRLGTAGCSSKPLLEISSVADIQDSAWIEVEADGIYVIDLRKVDMRTVAPVCHSWERESLAEVSSVFGIAQFNMSSDPPVSAPGLTMCSPIVQCLRDRLSASLRVRVLNVPTPPDATARDDARIAVLYSGGLDCALLARLVHDILPLDECVDLINVAFENPRVMAHLPGDIADAYEACPDRITGRKSFSELQRLCPGRRWRFIATNISYSETLSHRPEIIALMYPHKTEMDLSIATALYFAARGAGNSMAEQNVPPRLFRTTARVLLSGLGADELFGGYGRHGVAYSRQGYSGLVDELRLDVTRLGKRNLGRDDRVISHWGKEVRFPYLDEQFLKWAVQLPVWEKCDYANPSVSANGDVEPVKRLLRLAALSLGLEGVAREKKRAIQFGSRTAKMGNGRVKGTALVS